MNLMSVPLTRISLLIARRVSSSYTDLIGCISSVNIRTISVGRTHVRRLFWLPMSCMSSSETIISSLFASHVSGPYSIQIDSKPSVNIQICWFDSSFNPYSYRIRGMSNANTRISSLAVNRVKRLITEWLYIKRLKRSLWGGLNHFWSPYSAQIRCK